MVGSASFILETHLHQSRHEGGGSNVSASDPNPTTNGAISSESHSKTGIIAGVTVGGVAFILGALLVLAFLRRRRRSARSDHQVVFNRELMFQRRPSPYDSWTLRSMDLEKGSLTEAPRIYVTKTMTSDRDL
ncbi:hypothetical protein AN958_01447 [Leucoagaricus sp. SymC.cos]|nr:hypothetical protein AN958_01447 [Leucoagaricus sp. SymC.cos]